MDGAHLVGDGADAADAGDDVQDLVGRPALDDALEVAGRLEDAQVRLDHLAVADDEPQRALALDAGESRDLETLVRDRRVVGGAVMTDLRSRDGAGLEAAGRGTGRTAVGVDDRAERLGPGGEAGEPRARDRVVEPGGVGDEARHVGAATRSEAAVAAAPEDRTEGAATGPGHGPEARHPLGDDDAGGAAPLAFRAHGFVGQLRPTTDHHRGQQLQELARIDRDSRAARRRRRHGRRPASRSRARARAPAGDRRPRPTGRAPTSCGWPGCRLRWRTPRWSRGSSTHAGGGAAPRAARPC